MGKSSKLLISYKIMYAYNVQKLRLQERKDMH